MTLTATSYSYPYVTLPVTKPSLANNPADPMAVLEDGQPAKSAATHPRVHHAARHTVHHAKHAATHHGVRSTTHHTSHATTHHAGQATKHHAASTSAHRPTSHTVTPASAPATKAPHLIAPPKHASSEIRRWWSDALAAGKKYGVDPRLVLAVITVESSGNPHAVSSVGARGLMQLMPSTAHGLGVRNVANPQQNIDGGTRYLSQLMKRYGRTNGLRAYNGGPGGIHYHETAQYAQAVMSHYQRYMV